MKQGDAKPLFCNAFRRWLAEHPEIKNPKAANALLFFMESQKSGIEALNFQCRGDKWQTVKGWLIVEGLCEI